jgi:hypothetical protein
MDRKMERNTLKLYIHYIFVYLFFPFFFKSVYYYINDELQKMTPIYWNTRFLGLFIYLALPLTKMADTRFWLEEQRMLMRSGKKEKTKGKTMRWKRSFEVSESARAGRPITFRVPRVLLLLLLLCWKHSPTCHAVTNWTAGWPLEAEEEEKQQDLLHDTEPEPGRYKTRKSMCGHGLWTWVIFPFNLFNVFPMMIRSHLYAAAAWHEF